MVVVVVAATVKFEVAFCCGWRECHKECNTHTNTHIFGVHLVQNRRQSSVIYTNYIYVTGIKLLYISFESLKNYLRELYIC